jgi:hypothetical protein
MRNSRSRTLVVPALALADLCLSGFAEASASRGAGADKKSAKPEAAATAAARPPAAAPASPAAPVPSIKETLAAVTQISHELKLIEARLASLDQSLAGVNASVAPLGALAQPRALRSLILLAAARERGGFRRASLPAAKQHGAKGRS